MKIIKVVLTCCMLFTTIIIKAQVYEDPVTGNVGIGTSTIDNTQSWNKVLQLNGLQHAKFLVTENSGVKVGMYAHAGYNGKIGTESNNNLTFTAGYWNDVMTLTTAGNVGIGTLDPQTKFHLVGSGTMLKVENTDGITANQFSQVNIKAGASDNYIWSNNENSTGFYGGSGALNIYTGQNSPIAFFTNGGNERMRVDGSGNVGIGTNNPNEKLAVNGNIRAREVKVETANWPDYVFTKSYQLPTLQETENHIKEKGHLPGIPSAAEVKANGINLGEMDAKLLQKIEELTLHLIEMKKQNDLIQKEIKSLKESKK
ncbi:hypothetical protein [Pedobacter heparinus]|uniref:hypothetical protein n=1 Tax=Pedobacter heparinus TaxID=984 RepID=UPI002930F6DE|nr:hypothetical protein [Pedobacter heparinus]